MIYKIINPSDPYTMESDSPIAACLACMLLGGGAYTLENDNKETVCPFFMFGGDPEKWMMDTFGVGIKQAIDTNRTAVVAALSSVLIGDRAERAMLLSVPDDAKEKYIDRKRTSMNDIGSRAKALAKRLTVSLEGQ